VGQLLRGGCDAATFRTVQVVDGLLSAEECATLARVTRAEAREREGAGYREAVPRNLLVHGLVPDDVAALLRAAEARVLAEAHRLSGQPLLIEFVDLTLRDAQPASQYWAHYRGLAPQAPGHAPHTDYMLMETPAQWAGAYHLSVPEEEHHEHLQYRTHSAVLFIHDWDAGRGGELYAYDRRGADPYGGPCLTCHPLHYVRPACGRLAVFEAHMPHGVARVRGPAARLAMPFWFMDVALLEEEWDEEYVASLAEHILKRCEDYDGNRLYCEDPAWRARARLHAVDDAQEAQQELAAERPEE
jgi:hypothetical protein